MGVYVPPQIIEEIRQKTDIVELISEYLTLKKQGKNFVCNCPFHSENTPSFSVSPEKQIFYCFGCQKGGDAISFVMEIEGLTYPEAAVKLAERVGVVIPEKEYTPQQSAWHKEKQAMLRMHQMACDFYRQNLYNAQHKVGLAYCAKRNLTSEILTDFGIGLAPESDWEALCHYLQKEGFVPSLIEKAGLVSKSAKTGRYYDKFHGRLIFPICDFRGHVIAFGGRIMGDGQPKYLNSQDTPIYNKHQHLYALNIASQSIRQEDVAIIMEGYMDVIAAHQHGVKNAVASLGTALSTEQVKLLKRYTTNVLLAYDGDMAGVKAAQRGLEIMSEEGLNIRILSLPNEMDPDNFLQKYGKVGWNKFVKEKAQGVLEYLLSVAESKYPDKTITDKGLIIKELVPAIVRTTGYVERDSFIKLLALRLDVSVETVYADLVKNGVKIAHTVAKKDDVSQTVTYAKSPSVKKVNPLLKLVLQNKECFYLMKEKVGYDFCRFAEEKQLVEFVEQLGEKYDWEIITLLHILPSENEGLRQLLLNLLQTDIPDSNNKEIIESWIKSCQVAKIQAKIHVLQSQLTSKSQNAKEILIEINELQKEVQRLKS